MLLLLLYTSNWDTLSLAMPSDSNSVNPHIPSNKVLQFFLDVICVLIIGVPQIIFFKLVSIRLPTEHQNFIDTCAVANISVFVLDAPLHGY